MSNVVPIKAVVDAVEVDEDVSDEMLVRGDHVELADLLIDTLRPTGVDPISALGTVYSYKPDIGIWCALDSAFLSRTVQGFAGMPIKKKAPLSLRANDVAGTIRMTRDRITSEAFFDEAPRGIAFTDGFVRITNAGMVERIDHSHENRARFAFPFPFAVKHPRKKWIAFGQSLFEGDDDSKLKIGLVREFFGAALIGVATTYQRCLVLSGEGANGKSALLNIISAAMPPGSTCAVPPQQWGNEYYRAMMAGSLLNVVSELPEQDIIAAESFKAIVTGDAIPARHIRESPFTYRPSAAHAFAANTLPGTPDQSDGFWRRFAVLAFNRRFGADAQANIAKEIIEDEMPGIVRWLIEGAARIVARGSYALPASHDGALATWRNSSDQVSAFLADCTRPVEAIKDGTPARKLYETYTAWAKKSGHHALSITKFGMRLDKLGRKSLKTRNGNVVPVMVTLAGWARS